LADNAIETIDQVSGRIQSKLTELDASDVSVSDEAVQKLKDIFSTSDAAPADQEKQQGIAEILNSIGSKVQKLKDFFAGKDSGKEDKKEKGEKEVKKELGLDFKKIFANDKLFVKFVDEVMPEVKFFETIVKDVETCMAD